MDVYAKLSALATLALTAGAIIVTFWSPDSFRWRAVIVFLFIVIGVVGVALQEEHDKQERKRSDAVEEQIRRDILGHGTPEVVLTPPLDGSDSLDLTVFNHSRTGNLYDLRIEIQPYIDKTDYGEALLKKINSVQKFNVPWVPPLRPLDPGIKVQLPEGKYFISTIDRTGQTVLEEIEVSRAPAGWPIIGGRISVEVLKFTKNGQDYVPRDDE